MKPTFRLLLVLIAAASTAGPAAAQFGPPQLDADTPVVSELVVRAFGGPAWWKVSDKDTTVYILGDPGPLPPGVTFDQSLLERRLTGANVLITGPKVELGMAAIFALPSMLGLIKDLNGSTKRTLEPSLPPPVRARFVAAREKIGQPETRYGSLPPGLAGMALAGDTQFARDQASPRPTEAAGVAVAQAAAQAAQRKKVRVTASAKYGGTVAAFQFLSAIKKPGMSCLVSSLDEIEKPIPARRDDEDDGERLRVLRAWADGDLKPLLDAQRRGVGRMNFGANFEGGKGRAVRLRANTPPCLEPMKVVSRITASWIPDEAAAITLALKKPGHAVAVMEIGSLVVKDGVLDRLRRQGFEVTAPNGVD